MHELRPACGVLLLALGCAGAVQDAQDAGAASGIFCPAGDEYTGGRCLPICPSSQIRCDGYHCVDLKGDRANCGVCGNLCAAGLDCLEGQCLCPKGTTACDGVCIDLASDPAHCGTCGKACPSAASCIEGRCSAACSAVFPNGPTELSLSGSAYELWVGDFDGDGLTDVVGGGGNGPVQLWRGIGLREFAPPQILTGENLSSFAVGDFDGDGRLDVVASSNSGAGAILFFRSTPSGLAPAVIIAAGLTAVPVAADLNNDGRSDLLLVGEGTLQVMFSTPGGWSAPQIVDGGGAWVARSKRMRAC